MSVSIDNVQISKNYVLLFERFMSGPRGQSGPWIELRGKGIDDEMKETFYKLREYEVGNIIQLVDNIKSKYSDTYKITEWKLTTKGKTPIIYEFDCTFQGV